MGEDYKQARKSFIQLGTYDQVGANLTRYFGPGGLVNAVEADARTRIPSTCTLQRMTVYLDAAPGGADTVIVTLMVGAAPTAITLTLTGADRHGANNVATLTIPYFNFYSIRVVTSATCAPVRLNVMFEGIVH